MRILNWIATAIITLIIVGCAHTVSIDPGMDRIQQTAKPPRIDKTVAYYIPQELQFKQVITPGGGNDKVRYAPYNDIEMGFYKMLSNVFSKVVKIHSPKDIDLLTQNKVSFIVLPEIATNSSSSNTLTWPPTSFNLELTCKITDINGAIIVTPTVHGEGKAAFSEFKRDAGLSGRRASIDALLKMQDTLLNDPLLRK